MENNNNKVKFLQYVNTGLLTAILAFLTINQVTLSNLRSDNLDLQKEMLRLKTIQDIYVSRTDALSVEVNTIKTYQLDALKSWIDQNYVRKSQSK